jgi:hypothetical protein
MEHRTFSPTQAVKYGFKALYNHVGLLLNIFLILVIILGGLLLVLGLINPAFSNELMIFAKQKMASQDEFMSFISRHKLFLIVVAPLYYVLFCTLMAGLIRIFLDLVDRGSSNVKRLFSMASYALQVTALSFCMFVLHRWSSIFDGILKMINPHLLSKAHLETLSTTTKVLIAIPAILIMLFMFYISLRLIFVLLSFVDQKKGIVPSFVHSWNITSGNVIKLILFFILMGVVFVPLIIVISMALALVIGNNFPVSGYVIMIFFANAFLCMFSIGILSLTYVYRQLSPKHINFEID